MTHDQRTCKDFLNANSRKFGITETNFRSDYLDICVRNVRCIASRRIDEKIVLPSMSSFINSCTGLVDSAGGIDTSFASLRITHAAEELTDCDTNCPGVKVIIKGQIIVRTKSCNPCCAPSYMAIPVELCSEVIQDFYYTSNGEKVTPLKNELPNIDGSCMVINLNCRVYREVCNGCSRYIAHIRGSIVDKLWKLENIWVEGIRPYSPSSVTVCDKFSKDICTCYDDDDYVCLSEQDADDICCDSTKGGGCCTNQDCGCGTYSNVCCCADGFSTYANGCGCTDGYDNNCCSTGRTNSCECE